jgi:hypothetical protein
MSFLKNPGNPENPEITPKGGFENSQLPTGLGIPQELKFFKSPSWGFSALSRGVQIPAANR